MCGRACDRSLTLDSVSPAVTPGRLTCPGPAAPIFCYRLCRLPAAANESVFVCVSAGVCVAAAAARREMGHCAMMSYPTPAAGRCDVTDHVTGGRVKATIQT